MQVSIVIPSYNRSNDLMLCIDSVRSQKNCTFEIIIVDDASTDQTANVLAKEFPEVIVIPNSHNFGPSYARNIGINAAKGDYILFLDSDTVFDNETRLENFMFFFNNHNNVGSVGGEFRAYAEKDAYLFGKKILFDGNSCDQPIINSPGSFSECDFLATCCCMVKKETAIRIGGFDPYYGFGGEDKDFGFRIKQLGLKNYVSADCAVKHFHSPKGRSIDETFKYHFTRIRFGLKCFSFSKKIILINYMIFKSLIFYLMLPFKISIYISIKRPIAQENFLGGWLIIKALWKNIKIFGLTKESRSKNHLSQDEIDKFVSYSKLTLARA